METLGTERKPNLEQKSSFNTRKSAITALMTALETVSTIFFTVPIPATSGYFNFGEPIIYFTALIFGPFVGAFVGGVGAAIADMIYAPVFAPVTLISKGLEGFITGSLYLLFRRKSQEKLTLKKVLSIIPGGFAMILGYFIYEAFIGGVGSALGELPFNVIQMIVGLITALILTAALERYIPALNQ
jgi:uncharacterized membrane protein